jgi:hypothetical protein
MRKMFSLLMSMPVLVLANLSMLTKNQPKRPLTAMEILMRLQVIDELIRCLPAPDKLSRWQLISYQVVMNWLQREILALRALQQLNVILVGAVPVVHEENLAREKLS